MSSPMCMDRTPIQHFTVMDIKMDGWNMANSSQLHSRQRVYLCFSVIFFYLNMGFQL